MYMCFYMCMYMYIYLYMCMYMCMCKWKHNSFADSMLKVNRMTVCSGAGSVCVDGCKCTCYVYKIGTVLA